MAARRRIMVVDDEPQITRVLRTSLSSQGYDLRVANDGETALEIMKDWVPDLVITDLSMPNMDGLELCRRLRSVSQTPIIVLSVRGEERMKVKALDAGADDYVTKPFGIEELLAHATQRQFVYTHRWRVHDLVIWDDRCTMHRGTEFDDLRWKRDMQRATVCDVANSCEQAGIKVEAA